MCDTALSRAALELTQKIQMHFPPDIDPRIMQAWIGCSANTITEQLRAAFGHNPNDAKFVVEVKNPAKPKPALLEAIGTVVVSATNEKFVSKDKFVINTKRDALVKISYLGDNFQSWFGEKVEDPIAETTLCYAKLRKSSVDTPIIAELGGKEKSETTLMEMFSLMEKQKNGESGTLLNNGWANIFYIRDIAGVLRTVSGFWDGVGWRVGADSVEDPGRWDVGRRVFSRNSVLEPSESVSAAS